MENLKCKAIADQQLDELRVSFKALPIEDQRREILRGIYNIRSWMETTDRNSFPDMDWDQAEILSKSMIRSMESQLMQLETE